MRGITLLTAEHVHEWNTRTERNGKWILTRPEGHTCLSLRVKAAWMVFTGKADALIWGGQ